MNTVECNWMEGFEKYRKRKREERANFGLHKKNGLKHASYYFRIML